MKNPREITPSHPAQRPQEQAELRLLVAGGGTGGHIYPALAVIERLQHMADKLSVLWLASDRRFDEGPLTKAGIEFLRQPARPFSIRPWAWPGVISGWRGSVRLAKQVVKRFRPHVTLATGGFAGCPAAVTSARLSVPTFVLNPDAKPGLANRLAAAWAHGVFVQWPETRRYLPAGKAVVTGCPVRAEFFALSQPQAKTILGLEPDRPALLITGASQGARNINLAMAELSQWLQENFPDWQVIHIAGSRDYEHLCSLLHNRPQWRIFEFLDDMAAAMIAADIIVSRAGASSLAEISAVGRPSILMPYPYDRSKHQYANARIFQQAGAALVVRDRGDIRADAEALKCALQKLLAEPDLRHRMARAAKTVGRPDAADTIARILLQAARRPNADAIAGR